jgi:hypothetical protein
VSEKSDRFTHNLIKYVRPNEDDHVWGLRMDVDQNCFQIFDTFIAFLNGNEEGLRTITYPETQAPERRNRQKNAHSQRGKTIDKMESDWAEQGIRVQRLETGQRARARGQRTSQRGNGRSSYTRLCGEQGRKRGGEHFHFPSRGDFSSPCSERLRISFRLDLDRHEDRVPLFAGLESAKVM